MLGIILIVNYIFKDESKESAIVSRYVSSMKKKPSLQKIINNKKKYPYQPSTSTYNISVPQDDASTSTQSSSHETIQLV